ncbi:ABC-2 type transport system ATP-binding protein [Pelagirhabdus alkalitolerans]|uniref:ABC-2 type transport system ATP-binding protein n=1 Tax=Pelagirhabdus alkalitolerans TaxID=1612202 RepID=A0A1G6MJP6_9BACI|nr:ATP-binding cassette domain-containing protein [Pelagirhabdus alkalitolerans]SDC55753.1 ABC-2 type transport system ATP-binding protein [Pelagirhabdus alkalitolerans]
MKEKNEDTWAIETTDLVKHFGDNRAVDGVNLKVKKGSIYGVLGPNGAGKTTAIRMLTTLLKPDAGTANVLGFDVIKDANQVKQRISLTGQFASLDEDLSGLENMVMIGRLLGFSRKEAKQRGMELLMAFGLQDAAKRQVKNYSGGMRRRLDIAASIIVSPEILFLDEPTTGLDPRSRNQVWDIIRLLVDAGTTVLLTTQYLDEADQLADRIAVIDHGEVIAEGTSSELKASVGSGKLHVRVLNPDMRDRAAEILKESIEADVHLASDPLVITAQVSDHSRVARALTALESAEITMTDFSLGQPSLDEVFLTLTGKPAEAENEVEEVEETA